MNEDNYLTVVGELVVMERHTSYIEDAADQLNVHYRDTTSSDDKKQGLVRFRFDRTGDASEKHFAAVGQSMLRQKVPMDWQPWGIDRRLVFARVKRNLEYYWARVDLALDPNPPGWIDQDQRWCELQTHELLDG